METLREKFQPLYNDGSLLGFAIFDADGNLLGNDSYFSDESARKVADPFMTCLSQLSESQREVLRLTVRLDQEHVIFTTLDDHYALYFIDHSADLDTTVAQLGAAH